MYPQRDAKMLRALVAKHSQYSVIMEALFLKDITEYNLLDNDEIDRLIEVLKDIYIENIKDEDEQREIDSSY